MTRWMVERKATNLDKERLVIIEVYAPHENKEKVKHENRKWTHKRTLILGGINMDDKGRLEAIKNIITEADLMIDKFGEVDYAKQDELILSIYDDGHLEWLFRQAKENQSNDKQMLIKANIAKQKKIDKLQGENEALGSALHSAQHELRVLKGRKNK